MKNLNELKHLSPAEFDAALAEVVGKRMTERLSLIPAEQFVDKPKPKAKPKSKAE